MESLVTRTKGGKSPKKAQGRENPKVLGGKARGIGTRRMVYRMAPKDWSKRTGPSARSCFWHQH